MIQIYDIFDQEYDQQELSNNYLFQFLIFFNNAIDKKILLCESFTGIKKDE